MTVTFLTKELLEKDYAELHSWNLVANKYNVGKATVYRKCKNFGIALKERPQYEKLLTEEFLRSAYKDLKSVDAISEKYDVPPTTVWTYCHKFDILDHRAKYTVNSNILSEDNEQSFYLAGFIAADGCINTCHNKIMALTIGLSAKDKEFLTNIKNIMGFTGPLFEYSAEASNGKRYNIVRLSIFDKVIINDLLRFGIGPRKSLTYNFPSNIIDHKLVSHFMRGYSDGDGCFFRNKRDNMLGFCLVGTESFLISYKEILERECHLNSKSQIKFHNGTYALRISGNLMVPKIANFLYNNASIYLPRKFNIAMGEQ